MTRPFGERPRERHSRRAKDQQDRNRDHSIHQSATPDDHLLPSKWERERDARRRDEFEKVTSWLDQTRKPPAPQPEADPHDPGWTRSRGHRLDEDRGKVKCKAGDNTGDETRGRIKLNTKKRAGPEPGAETPFLDKAEQAPERGLGKRARYKTRENKYDYKGGADRQVKAHAGKQTGARQTQRVGISAAERRKPNRAIYGRALEIRHARLDQKRQKHSKHSTPKEADTFSEYYPRFKSGMFPSGNHHLVGNGVASQSKRHIAGMCQTIQGRTTSPTIC